MSDPIKTTTEIIQDDIAALKAKVASFETEGVCYSQPLWERTNNVLYLILNHLKSFAYFSMLASITAFVLKLIHG